MTRVYEATARAEGQHEIEYLWSQVDQLKPDDWPPGVAPTPTPHDIGTAGFPDGAGLYWRTGQPMPPFPIGGVMFVGHNTDAEDKHPSRRVNGRSPGEPDNPVMDTWRNLYESFRLADFDPREMFFTNVYVGLKRGDAPEGPFPGASDPTFRSWCRAFLDTQIQMMRPRAVVTLGAPAREDFGWPRDFVGRCSRGGVTFHAAALHHPTSRWRHRKVSGSDELRIDRDVRILREIANA